MLQRLVIAEAIFQGATIDGIARRLGVSRSWASREANAPQTRVMLVSLLDSRAETIAALTDHAFDAIEDAFRAVKVIPGSNLQIEAPDHRIRLDTTSDAARARREFATRRRERWGWRHEWLIRGASCSFCTNAAVYVCSIVNCSKPMCYAHTRELDEDVHHCWLHW
jgi:hypothetical protein